MKLEVDSVMGIGLVYECHQKVTNIIQGRRNPTDARLHGRCPSIGFICSFCRRKITLLSCRAPSVYLRVHLVLRGGVLADGGCVFLFGPLFLLACRTGCPRVLGFAKTCEGASSAGMPQKVPGAKRKSGFPRVSLFIYST